MNTEQFILILLGFIILILIILICLLLVITNKRNTELRADFNRQLNEFRQDNNTFITSYIQTLTTLITQNQIAEEQKLDNLRSTLDFNITKLNNENNKQLEAIRKTVDDKLQETLNSTLSKSFKIVSDQLEQVHQGLGEMHNLANGVGDLKKVLSNVKTRGIFGEIQLGAILKEILTSSQYKENYESVPNSDRYVEYAIKLPGLNDEDVYLPIDSKYPMDAYQAIIEASENGDKAALKTARDVFTSRLKKSAKEIIEKYVAPPFTTDFAILFLPTEGIYAEACNLGLVESFQKEFKIMLAGPSTMAALLNSLQMGFKTLAIQKRSSEVWELLTNVKEEFNNFAATLKQTQLNLESTADTLEQLVGVRTRKLNKQLNKIHDFGSNLIEENKQEED